LGIVGGERDGNGGVVHHFSCVDIFIDRLDERVPIWRAGTGNLDDLPCGIGDAIAVPCAGGVKSRLKTKFGDKGRIDVALHGGSDDYSGGGGEKSEGEEEFHSWARKVNRMCGDLSVFLGAVMSMRLGTCQ
jgi:hypothetical protein